MKLLINKDIEITLKYSDKQTKIELLQHINEDFSPQLKELNVAHSVYYSRSYIRITVPAQKIVLGEVEMNKFLFMLSELEFYTDSDSVPSLTFRYFNAGFGCGLTLELR